MHETVKSLYSWHNVSERAEKVYYKVMESPGQSLLNRLKMSMTLGPFAGLGQVFFMLWLLTCRLFFDWFWPRQDIFEAENFDVKFYKKNAKDLGDHTFDPRSSEGLPEVPLDGKLTPDLKRRRKRYSMKIIN
jgi:hypothetical protein